MRQSEEIDQLSAALVEAQGHFAAVDKTASNTFFQNKYADLPAIVRAVQPILLANGLAVTQWPSFDGEHDLLTTRIIHTSGQWIEDSVRLYLVKLDPQGLGSAITYARRYALSAALGIVTEEDDDGNAASPKRRTQKPAQRPQERPAHQDRPTSTNGSCGACGGSEEKTLASGRVIPCPVCKGKEEAPASTEVHTTIEEKENGTGGDHTPPSPESLEEARRLANLERVKGAKEQLGAKAFIERESLPGVTQP